MDIYIIGDYIYLKVDREIIFGRKKGDIILKNDESISRLHASIRIKVKEVIRVFLKNIYYLYNCKKYNHYLLKTNYFNKNNFPGR